MTNKRKKRARDLSAKTGMSHQAAINALNEADKKSFQQVVKEVSKLIREIQRPDSKPFPSEEVSESFASYEAMTEYVNSIPADQHITVIPADVPEAGQIGFMLYQTLEGLTELGKRIYWEPFGKMTPKVTEFGFLKQSRSYVKGEDRYVTPVSAPEEATMEMRGNHMFPTAIVTVAFVREWFDRIAQKRLFKADNPKTLQCGFVYYEDGIAHITMINLTSIKERVLHEVNGLSFRDWRNSVPELRAEVDAPLRLIPAPAQV